MDTPALPEALKRAGADYQRKLRALGLDPEGFLWAFDRYDEKFHLWIVWSGVDEFGPYKLAQLLFKAYRLSALPQEIDPFTVEVLSPRLSIVHALRRLIEESIKKGPQEMKISETSDHTTELTRFKTAWIYKFDRKDLPTTRVLKDWKRFQHNVGALAA
ncbi:hypothetical protein [Microvirga lenta]|uniref:hypothetical protein n=1 Tax=Microvirga lenta TaxID=2881337 RepID=UPI001CFF6047|nr:hypothetical protein [Microvirga lenta]MCB5176302.1 hypothetical protein [Microvirga lenta]